MADNQFWNDLREYNRSVGIAATVLDPAAAMAAQPNAAGLIRRHGLERMFVAIREAVDSGDSDNVAIGCEALESILSSAQILAALSDGAALMGYVGAASQSSEPCVRHLAVKFMRRVASGQVRTGFARQLLYDPACLGAAAGRLADPDTAIAETATDALHALAGGKLKPEGGWRPGQVRGARTSTPEPDSVQIKAVVDSVKAFTSSDAFDSDSTLQIRVFALIARLCGTSDAVEEACQHAGLTSLLICSVVDSEDVLLQLNILELLPPLARSRRGLEAMVSSGMLVKLYAWAGIGRFEAHADLITGASSAASASSAGNANDGDADPILGSASLSAVGEIYSQALSSQYSHAAAILRGTTIPGLFRVCEAACAAHTEEDRTMAAIGALAAVLSVDALAVDAALTQEHRPMVREWLELGVSTIKPLRLACIASLARIVHAGPAAIAALTTASSPPGSGSASALPSPPSSAGGATGGSTSMAVVDPFARYHNFFDRLGQHCGMDSVDVIVRSLNDITAQEVRYACFDLLSAVVSLPPSPGSAVPWGLRRVFGHPGLGQYLLSRDSETTKEGKEWKYSVIVAALGNPGVRSLGDEVVGTMIKYRDRGAYAADMAGPGVATAMRTG